MSTCASSPAMSFGLAPGWARTYRRIAARVSPTVWSVAGPSSKCQAPEAGWKLRAYSASSTSRPVTCRMPSACPRARFSTSVASAAPAMPVGPGDLRQEVVRACLADVVDQDDGDAVMVRKPLRVADGDVIRVVRGHPSRGLATHLGEHIDDDHARVRVAVQPLGNGLGTTRREGRALGHEGETRGRLLPPGSSRLCRRAPPGFSLDSRGVRAPARLSGRRMRV